MFQMSYTQTPRDKSCLVFLHSVVYYKNLCCQGRQSLIYFRKTGKKKLIIGSKFTSQRVIKDKKNKCESYLNFQAGAYICVFNIHILAGRMKIS